jgi:antitoxin component YwqK of YwqJK toxin-antitoxin module
MSRGRGQGEVGRRAPSLVYDPVGFRAWWDGASLAERLQYEWPQDLSYLDLSDLDLRGQDLRSRQFTGTNLLGTDLEGALLAGADVHSAKLDGTTRLDEDAFSSARMPMTREEYLAMPHKIIREGLFTLHYWFDREGREHRDNYPAVIYYNNHDGSLSRKEWYTHGENSPQNGMPSKEYYRDGQVVTRIWEKAGQRHRDGDRPAVVEYNHENGTLSSETWYRHGEVYRESGPSRVTYDRQGRVDTEEWVREGNIYNPNGPAKRVYHSPSGKVVLEEYHDEQGRRHRERKAAVVKYFKSGRVIQSMEWYQHGKRHRIEGPAIVQYSGDGKAMQKEWYRDGSRVAPMTA